MPREPCADDSDGTDGKAENIFVNGNRSRHGWRRVYRSYTCKALVDPTAAQRRSMIGNSNGRAARIRRRCWQVASLWDRALN
jgi:hypothetical protein